MQGLMLPNIGWCATLICLGILMLNVPLSGGARQALHKAPEDTTWRKRIPEEELEPQFWIDGALSELKAAISRQLNTNVAKNVILFLGDGMGPSTVTAARILKGQRQGRPGEEGNLVFDQFPNVALSKTYNVDHQVTDSAATATAFLCGVKANYGTLGVGPKVQRGDCRALKTEKNITCIAELAQRAGKSTGFVTTSRVTHATPAPLYARTSDRMWEGDGSLPAHAREDGCRDIAAQMLDPVGNNLNVVMGGGRKYMLPVTERDPEESRRVGLRMDRRNLVKEWLKNKEDQGYRAKYAWDRSTFNAVSPSDTDYLMGLFEYSHMNFEGDRASDAGGEPSLAEMTQKAIQILEKNDKGFFLLVEGARIDHGHHENTASRALEEVLSMEEAVKTAMKHVNLDETLIIVTADHSHPLSIASYARRGNPILGLTDYSDDTNKNNLSDVDYLPYTTLSYATGPGYQSPRPNLTNIQTDTRHYSQATTIPTRIVSHDGTDVGIYATGPMAHLFHSTHEQHYIFHVMAFASCIDDEKQHCLHHKKQQQQHPGFYRSQINSKIEAFVSGDINDDEPVNAARKLVVTSVLISLLALVTLLT